MAPEQIRGNPVTQATDIYSLVIVIYELLTGRPPFSGTETGLECRGTTTRERLYYAHLHLAPPDPWQFNPSLSIVLSKTIVKSLSKNPGNRYQAAWDIFQEIFAASGITLEQIPDLVEIDSQPQGDQTGIDLQPIQTAALGEKKFSLSWFSNKALLMTIISGFLITILIGPLIFFWLEEPKP